MYEKFGRAEKLLMRIRALKWQAGTTLAAEQQPGSVREQAAALVAELDALEASARTVASEDALASGEQQAEGLAARVSALRAS